MKYFDNGNKVSQDACALEHKQRENMAFNHYLTNSFSPFECEEKAEKLRQFAMEHPNLTFRIGQGVSSPCTIDNDSKLRMGAEITNFRGRRTLCKRNFVAGPDFSRGELHPNVESVLINGLDTIEKKDCHKLAELQFRVFQPFNDCVGMFVRGAADVIDDDIRIGKSSKDIMMAARCKQDARRS